MRRARKQAKSFQSRVELFGCLESELDLRGRFCWLGQVVILRPSTGERPGVAPSRRGHPRSHFEVSDDNPMVTLEVVPVRLARVERPLGRNRTLAA